ncbi:uncharacterized protein LOC130891048 [Diorhabda carinulata]|uniref:uncharacterized protein LOC130891048 n=1 Tax=Diorhabda carinulata TaxID=1163345 RepID=UPI0024E18DC1|nr:uncharacterized protein LOC130444021 isoform X1 [Diorhabda sublineata]XP_057651533.1 uncharacterized protein LOC130891048 [Diorhabda carinulata]
MALVENCFCCSLQIASGFFAAYLLIAYLIAFAFELLWILESEVALPSAAVLLSAGYFAMALFAALLIHGLATKNAVCLLSWMLSVTLLTFPEAGLVIYMSIQYWRIESLYGITELACWLIRIIINVIEIILIHSLHTKWKEEELVHKRIRDLNMVAIPVQGDNLPTLNSQFYQNNAYDTSLEQFTNAPRYGSTPNLWSNPVTSNMMMSLPFDGYQFYTTSEFNASIFVPNFANNIGSLSAKKAQSLMDLRLLEEHTMLSEKLNHQYHPWITQSISETSSAIIPTMSEMPPKQTKLTKCASVDALNVINKGNHIIKNRTGFYAQPIADYGVPIYYGPLDGPDFLIYKKKIDKMHSKTSLTNTTNTSAEDVQKYRDVAL